MGAVVFLAVIFWLLLLTECCSASSRMLLRSPANQAMPLLHFSCAWQVSEIKTQPHKVLQAESVTGKLASTQAHPDRGNWLSCFWKHLLSSPMHRAVLQVSHKPPHPHWATQTITTSCCGSLQPSALQVCNGSKSSHTLLESWAGGKEGVLGGNSHHGFSGTPADREVRSLCGCRAKCWRWVTKSQLKHYRTWEQLLEAALCDTACWQELT